MTKKNKYFQFLQKEYFDQKTYYTKIISATNNRNFIVGVIVTIISMSTNTFNIWVFLSILGTLVYLLVNIGNLDSKNIQDFDCYNIETFEDTISYNNETYSKLNIKLAKYFRYYLLFQLVILILSILCSIT